MWPFPRKRKWFWPVLKSLLAGLGLYLVARLFARLVDAAHGAAAPRKPAEKK